MASLFNKLAHFAKSPQGRRMVYKAKQKAAELAKDPHRQQQAKNALYKVKSRMNRRKHY